MGLVVVPFPVLLLLLLFALLPWAEEGLGPCGMVPKRLLDVPTALAHSESVGDDDDNAA